MLDTCALVDLKVYHVEIEGVTETPLCLPESQPGMALRGAFFSSLWERFCTNHAARTCADCPLHGACPVSALVAPLRDEQPRGRDVPRPYTIRVLQPGGPLPAGARLRFGLTLFGGVLSLLPYVVLAAHEMGRNGVGTRAADGRRGRFGIDAITAINLVTGDRQDLLDPTRKLTRSPTLAADAANITARVNNLLTDRVTLEFLTPTRLVDNGALVRRPAFRPLFQRLLERVTALDREYGAGGACAPAPDFRELLDQAEQIALVEDGTHWVEVASYSMRHGRSTPIGGLLGSAQFAGNLAPFLPWLAWGELVQVGKDVVKGNGWYRLQ